MTKYIKYNVITNKNIGYVTLKNGKIVWYDLNLSDFSKNLLRTWIGLFKKR